MFGTIPPISSTPVHADSPQSRRRTRQTSRLPRAAAIWIVVVAIGSIVAACGSSPAAQVQSGVVKAPDVALQGCTYELNGKIPTGEPRGVRPHFSSFSPDASATSALETMKEHDGVALANGFVVPGDTVLYAGPDTSEQVGTIPSNYAILAAEPVIWKSHSGGTWIAFFVSCGSRNLYWVSLEQIDHANRQAAERITPVIARGPLDPIAISHQSFVWKGSALPFIIGRGEMFGPVAE